MVGLVGESGSGKSTLVLAVLHYLSQNARILSGRIELAGQNLLTLSQREMQAIWGRHITLVPQDPFSSLNPSIRIGEQIAEMLRFQLKLPTDQARQRAMELLEMVKITNPQQVAENYPHQISGGMQQRVLIALALSTEPDLLVLDEPTTSLDVTTQAVVLDLIRDLIRERRTAALYITHNLGVVAQLCDRVAVLYAGELVEQAPTHQLFATPLHPYTRGLLDSIPRLTETKTENKLRFIQGQIPSLSQRDKQKKICIFLDRCPLELPICLEHPPLYDAGGEHRSRCHRWQEIKSGTVDARQPLPEPAEIEANGGAPILQVDGLEVWYPVHNRLGEVLLGRAQQTVRAVDRTSLQLTHKATVGLVGESGSGKTTIARAIVGLVEPDGGSIELLGVELPKRVSRRGLNVLRQIQMIFQDPDEALNPSMTVGEVVSRPLVTLLGMPPRQARRQIPRLLEAVRLPAGYASRLAEELSGGERQRVAIARAFAANPDVLICDEPVSALDVSVQAVILNLLNSLQGEYGTSLLFISHDLAVVGYLADEIAVIYLGRIMEAAKSSVLFEPPLHPYTEALLSATPSPDPGVQHTRIHLEGEIPTPQKTSPGCPFHSRCPRKLGEICEHVEPPWQVTGSGKRIYCHIPLVDLATIQAGLNYPKGASADG